MDRKREERFLQTISQNGLLFPLTENGKWISILVTMSKRSSKTNLFLSGTTAHDYHEIVFKLKRKVCLVSVSRLREWRRSFVHKP